MVQQRVERAKIAFFTKQQANYISILHDSAIYSINASSY